VQAPLGGGSEHRLVLQGDVQLSPCPLAPNAVDKTGRILPQLILPNNTFWPAGVIDQNTGHVQIIRIGYDAYVGGGGLRTES
jgi:hypothetical protein